MIKIVNYDIVISSYWVKVLLGKKVYGKDIEDIIEISSMYLKDNQILPEYIQSAITSITLNYNIRQNEEERTIAMEYEKKCIDNMGQRVLDDAEQDRLFFELNNFSDDDIKNNTPEYQKVRSQLIEHNMKLAKMQDI